MLDYKILCYRVMYRQKETEEWNFEDFSTEEKATEFYKMCFVAFRFSKMLKIQTAII